MAEFFFELVSPERLVFSGLVEHVVAPGADGEFGVLAGHAPFVSTLKPGLLSVHSAAETKRMFVRGGVAEARPDGLTVLSEAVVPLEEFDAAQLAQEIENAEEDVADATDEATRTKAQQQLQHLMDLRGALHAATQPGH